MTARLLVFQCEGVLTSYSYSWPTSCQDHGFYTPSFLGYNHTSFQAEEWDSVLSNTPEKTER